MDLVRYLKGQERNMVAVLKQVVELESPSTDKAATDALGSYLADLFRSAGAGVEVIPQTQVGDFIRAEWGEGPEQILLLCHIDTVWPVGELTLRPFVIDGDKAYGPGVYDMKAGIVQCYFAIRAVLDLNGRLPGRVVMFCNTDEEIGSERSRPYLEREAQRSKCVIGGRTRCAPRRGGQTLAQRLGHVRYLGYRGTGARRQRPRTREKRHPRTGSPGTYVRGDDGL